MRLILQSGSRITEMLNGRRALAASSGTSGEFWLNLQKLYELRQAEERMGAAITRLASPDDGYRPSARG